jgi:hypothetical protein
MPASFSDVARKTKDKEAGEAKEAELFQQYCFADAKRLRQAADEAGVAQQKSQLLGCP